MNPTIEDIKLVKIIENNEPLVEIPQTSKLVLLSEHKFLSPFLRKTVCDLLINASENLPEGYKLLVVTAYRPISFQKKLWRGRLFQMAKKYPSMMLFKPRKWIRLVTKYTAPPGSSFHQCGAAVDVTLIYNNGDRVDMGTSLTDFGEKCNTNYEFITDEQKNNRKILFDAMSKAGFVNYHMEWWHYSYGDQRWAAFNKKDSCMYGKLF